MNSALAPTPGLVRCPVCLTMLTGPWEEPAETHRACERCFHPLRISVFPALWQSSPVTAATGSLALEGEATCFFHADKRAERGCDRCGRFLCALCDLPVGPRHLCPACLGQDQHDKAVPELVAKRVSWGRLSFLLSLAPFIPLLNLFFIFTAPAAIFVGIYGWNKPGSLVHGKRRVAAVVGILLALLQLGGFGLLFFFGFKEAFNHAR